MARVKLDRMLRCSAMLLRESMSSSYCS
eukprot:COSAG01_NODE_47072_length_394_cov_0.532203_1_plen_27_part_10